MANINRLIFVIITVLLATAVVFSSVSCNAKKDNLNDEDNIVSEDSVKNSEDNATEDTENANNNTDAVQEENDNSDIVISKENSEEKDTDQIKTEAEASENGGEIKDNEETAENTGYELWTSTKASMGGEDVDFSDAPMDMYLALFDDGIYQMSVSVGDEVLENYPQEGTYSRDSDGTVILDTGWEGSLDENKLLLAYGSGSDRLVFVCDKQ